MINAAVLFVMISKYKQEHLRPMKKPINLVYGTDDVPPISVIVLSALQHGAILIFTMFTGLVICRAAGAPAGVVVNVLSVGLLVAGIGTLAQAVRCGPSGSGFLLPNGFQAAYLGPSIAAAQIGGMALVFGMTMVSGLTEMLLSRLWRRLRTFLPPEMSGIVVMLIGMQIATVGLRSLLRPIGGGPPTPLDLTIAGVTLSAMIVLNVWTRGNLKLFCLLIGVVVGYICALAAGLVSPATLGMVEGMPLLATPHVLELNLRFNAGMILPFLVAGVAATMGTSGNITVVQRMNDADWVGPDLGSISRGTLTDGAVATTAGLLGACGVGTIATKVGVMVATGVTARRVAFAFGAISILFAFLPRFSGMLAATPQPVVGGALLFSSCFTTMNGLQIITGRLIDARKSLVVGLALSAALAVNAYPDLSLLMPPALRPLAGSPLVAGTFVGLLLTAIFRLGIRRVVTMELLPGAEFAEPIEAFMLKHGAVWGARPDVIRRATFALTQLTDAIIEHCGPAGPIVVEAHFDEFNLDCKLIYTGDALEFPHCWPTSHTISISDRGMRRWAGVRLRGNAERILAERRGGRCRLHFHFDH
jgi:xanthine permease XanP